MSITPKSPAIVKQGWVQTWVTSRWKNPAIPGQFSAEINKPGFTGMVKFLRKHRSLGYTVIIDAIDRFARDVRGHWDLRDLLREAGGRLVSPKMEFKDDADSKMVENIHATFAQHFREKNKEQTLRRMRARVLGGYWPFQAPVGYEYYSVRNRGRLLRPAEPAASIVREALEGFASGRFDTQADVMRFLQDHPLFPKSRRGIVDNERTSILLRNPLYAGYVEAPNWNIPLREGQHEGLISFATFKCQSAAKFDPVSASNVDPVEVYVGEHPIRRSWSGLHSLIGCG